jgi:hypothetical protein
MHGTLECSIPRSCGPLRARSRGSHEKQERETSEAANLFGEEHVRRYRETGGEVGHIWRRGVSALLQRLPATTKAADCARPR